MLTNPNGFGPLVTRLMVAIATPTAMAGYFCFVRDWARSLTDHSPTALFRLDLTSMFPIALLGVAVFAVLVPAYLSSNVPTARADSPGPRNRGDFYRLFVSLGTGMLVFGTLNICNAPAGIDIIGGALSWIGIYAWASARTIMPWFRDRLAAAGYTERLHKLHFLGRLVRPYTGRRKLIEARLTDRVALLPLAPVLGVTAVFAVTGIGFAMGHGDAQAKEFEVVRVPGTEVILRHYNDEIVTAPLDLATETVTTRYTKRRLTTDRDAISIYHIHYTRPLQGFVPDESLKHEFIAAQHRAAAGTRAVPRK